TRPRGSRTTAPRSAAGARRTNRPPRPSRLAPPSEAVYGDRYPTKRRPTHGPVPAVARAARASAPRANAWWRVERQAGAPREVRFVRRSIPEPSARLLPRREREEDSRACARAERAPGRSGRALAEAGPAAPNARGPRPRASGATIHNAAPARAGGT